MHDIEEARTQGWASNFVTLDVQGAFDAVLHNRLIWRMHKQGWPTCILPWISCFLKHGRVQVRYLGEITPPKNSTCGIPQNSPISPPLFLLYMAELMKSGNVKARFGYADHIGVLRIGRTIPESVSVAQREVDSLLD